MKKITRWSPDTCECVLEYEWDTDTDENNRVHTYARHVVRCPIHAKGGRQAAYDQVVDENRRKNYAVTIVQTQIGSIRQEQIEWSFDEERRVVVRPLHPAAITRREELQGWLDLQFGPGRAILSP